MSRVFHRIACALVAAMVLFGFEEARAAERLPRQLDGVTVDEHLGASLDMTTEFQNQEGRIVQLREFFGDGKPVLLTLNYYRCPTLCTLQLNALNEGLQGLGWKPGDQFRIVTISIDANEGPKLAAAKRESYLSMLGMGNVDWTFLVGKEESIKRVAQTVGFGFKYDAAQDQYAHPLVLTFLTGEGKIARYLYGAEYSPRDLKFALMETSQGRAGSVADKLILSCFHYDSTVGAYAPFAMGIMRIAGAITALLVMIVLVFLWRADLLNSSHAKKEAVL